MSPDSSLCSSRLVWFPDSGAAGVDVPFQRIIMHAIARDAAACPRPCIFAQVEGATVEASQADEEEEEEEDDEPRSTELRLVPADEAARVCPRRRRSRQS
jgi:hypothetical protein